MPPPEPLNLGGISTTTTAAPAPTTAPSQAPAMDEGPRTAIPAVLTPTTPKPTSNTTTTAPARPPITCHVLDTTTGRPAADIPVTLTLISPLGPSAPLSAITNSDGRVASWGGTPSLEELFQSAAQGRNAAVDTSVATDAVAKGDPPAMVWAIKFDAGRYFKGDCFWTEIEIRFQTVLGQGTGEKHDHWHVPLLLGPWTYTTYRGS